MGINKDILNKAVDIINQRRERAKTENDLHFEEVNSKIPEIAEINTQLAKTGMEIMNVIKSGQNVSEKMAEMKEKNLQAQQIIKNLLVENGYPSDYLKIKYTCEKCGDTGFSDGVRCECFTNLAANLAAKQMNARSQVELCSFDSFRIDYYQGHSPEETEECRKIMTNILNYCRSYAVNFSTESNNVLMFGKTGLGKTHLSLAVANEVLKKGYTVLYDSAQNYLRQIEKEHFGRDSSGGDTLETLLSADLVILDDLGTEFDTSFYVSVIYNIINTRLNKGLPTIISTNLNHEGVRRKYDDRIVSRLFAVYDCLEFCGTDIRIIKKKLAMNNPVR
ncbi:MAG: ATP-binding protein [Porcipelethomonas sp.]